MAVSTARKDQMIDIAGFEFWLIQTGRKPRTVQKYRQDLVRLQREVEPFTPKNLQNYLLRLHKNGRTASYINMMIISAKVYARWAKIEGFGEVIEWKEVKPVKSVMSDEEIDQFLSLPVWSYCQHEPHYARWTLFYSILAFTGMRPGECAKLKVDDVDFGRSVFVLRDTKTNDNRLVPIPPHLLESLIRHVDESSDYLFPSLRGGDRGGLGAVVDSVDWHYNFHSRIKKLGIKRKGLSVYSLRHSFITRLLEEDVNLFKVQKIVGHKKIETTSGYTHLTTKDLQNTLKLDRMAKAKSSPHEKLEALKKYLLQIASQDDGIEYSVEEKDGEVTLKARVRNVSRNGS
jgi:integrase